MAGVVQPSYAELIRQGAQATVLHNDDTSAPIFARANAARSLVGSPR
jgi:hypothetical protein